MPSRRWYSRWMQPNLASELSLRGLGLPAWAVTVIALALMNAAACPRAAPAVHTPEPRVGRCSQHARSVQPRIAAPGVIVPVTTR